MKVSSFILFGCFLGSLSSYGAKDAGEHFMHDSIGHLHQAQKSLHDHPERDFGGHRSRAEQLTQEAINEVEAGLEWAKTHPKETH